MLHIKNLRIIIDVFQLRLLSIPLCLLAQETSVVFQEDWYLPLLRLTSMIFVCPPVTG